jgi:2-oxoglutarate dehydrogenase E1 component
VAWDAFAERNKRNAPVAVVRLEQLYPFPGDRLREVLAGYPNARDLVWLQEEPDNMGPWHFFEARFWRVKNDGYDLRLVSRIGSGSPATGSIAVHQQELAEMMDDTFRDL